MRLGVIIMIALILGALFIANKQQIDFKSLNSSMVFARIYGKWVWQVGTNIKDLAVIAYNMNWLPELGNVSATPQVTVLNISLS